MSACDPSLQASPSRPPATFFDLSRELRDYCYSLALTNPKPIIIWSGVRPETLNSPRVKWVFKSDLEPASQLKNATSDERNIAANLLRCNSVIAHEAASIFYGKNKFVFAGDWTWQIVATWFGNIGLKNRTFVASIELWQYQPSHAWQTATGERVKVVEFDCDPLEPPYPRSYHLYRSPDSTSVGLVDNINPAIETFFKLLGNENCSKLLLTFSLRRSFIPGVQLYPDEQLSCVYWCTMDLPNVIEKLRIIYAAGRVDVVWKGQLLKSNFQENRENIEAHWELLDSKEYDWTRSSRVKTSTHLWIRLTLKSKELPVPLLAAEPAPDSGRGHYTIEDICNPGHQTRPIRFGSEWTRGV